MKWTTTGLLSVLVSFAIVLPQAATASENDDVTTLAEAFVLSLQKGDYASAASGFDQTMKQVLPAPKLEAAWASLIKTSGPLKRQVGIRTEKVAGFSVVLVTCEFERATLDVKVVFNNKKEISGLWFVPMKSAVVYEPPAYANVGSFREKEVQVGHGRWILPGTLSLPLGDGTFPALVLVHGSGPNDRDETIGPNKPFRDLAWGLASTGIAVLRYDKRTKVHAHKMLPVVDVATVKEEVIDDAIAAVSLLRQAKGIDAGRVFVLGHSLGGTLIPRIALRDPKIAGFVVWAGGTQPLEDVILRQMTYVLSLDGLSEGDEKQLAAIREQVARVKVLEPSRTAPARDLPMGVHASYWLDLKAHHAGRKGLPDHNSRVRGLEGGAVFSFLR